MSGALDGVRVLELGHGIAGPFAGRLLGDFGAEVIKVESPRGDRLRAVEPLLRGSGHSVLFELLNANKRGLALDLADPASAPLLDELLDWADIAITSLRPARLRALDLTPADLLRRSPGLVATAVTSFGTEGPDADLEASELILQAASGLMSISGSADGGPLRHGCRTALWSAGLNAAYASLAGLLAVRATGTGVALDLSIREVLTSELVMNHAHYVFSGAVQGRSPSSPDPLDGNPLPTGDGELSLQTSARQPIDGLAALFGEPRLAAPRFGTPEERIANAEELRAVLAEHLGEVSARDVFLRASEAGLLSGVVQGAGELLDCPQLESRRAFHELAETAPVGRPWRLPMHLVDLSRTPTGVRRGAPRLNQHEAELRRELPAAARPAVEPASPLGEPRRPLAGLRVLDLSVIFAAPYMGGLLADLGAEVIKVEGPGRIDQTRTDWGGYFDNDPGARPWNRSGTFHVVNRGKRSLSLDLASEEGRRVLRELIARSDVLIDNFTPRVLPRWGMTYDSLKREHPRLVMLSNTGYGSTGPWAGFKAQGTTLEGTMGLMGVTGYPGGPPARAGQSVPDFFACWTGLVALLAALVERERSGLGQWIDLGMYQLGPATIPEALIARQVSGEDPDRVGVRDLEAELSAVLQAADGSWLAVSVADGEQRRALSELLGGSAESLEATLADWAAGLPAANAAARLQAAGIAAARLDDATTLLSDPQLRHRGFYETVAIAGLKAPAPLIGRPFSWSSEGSEIGIAAGGPDFGEANSYVLEGLLGLSEDEIGRLYAGGVVTDAPRGAVSARPQDFETLLAAGVLTRLEPKPEAVA